MEASDYDGSYESSTNWIITGGSLAGSIALESSFSSSADGDLDGSDEFVAADSAGKSPLILLPPPLNRDPCEITITFAQKHELRQVYVRSTARVYEIYCTNRPNQSKEYLCTVRCGLATRGEEVLQAPVIEATTLINPKEQINDSEGKRVKENGSGGKSEDDWVEVKASDASLLNNAKRLPAMPHERMQDLYEATAEINDVEPCISITIRFLSLQDKRFVFTDEVYIFADPADPTELEQEASRAGTSAGSSLMAMFMPTLLHLSRAKDVSRDRDRQTSNDSEMKSQETLRKSTDVPEIVNGIPQATNLSKMDDQKVNLLTTSEQADPETSQCLSGAEIKPASSCNHTDIILHQLVYRVSRIEDILSRFEDQLLKPIKSINTRLQQVEQKLEELGTKSKDFDGSAGPRVLNPDFLGSSTDRSCDIELDNQIENQQLASCSRIVVPEFSCSDADTSTASSSENMVDPPSDNHSPPGTEMITAESAEISDEKESDHSIERGSSEEKQKRWLSINDALASALAGFLSSTSTTDKKYSQALIVTAPEFSNEDDSETDKKAPINSHPDKSQVTKRATGTKDLEVKEPTSGSSTYAQNEPRITVSTDDISSELVNGVAKNCNHSESGYDDANTVVRDGDTDLGEGAVAESKFDCYAQGTEKESENQETPKDNMVDKPEDPYQSIGCLRSGLTTLAGDKKEPKIDDVLQSVLGFRHTSSSLDFGTPVLDVKFKSEQTSDNRSFFEALLNDSPISTAESVTAVDFITDSNHDNLISVDDEELIGPPTDTLSSVDLNCYEQSVMHLNLVGETQPELQRSSDEETTTESLL